MSPKLHSWCLFLRHHTAIFSKVNTYFNTLKKRLVIQHTLIHLFFLQSSKTTKSSKSQKSSKILGGKGTKTSSDTAFSKSAKSKSKKYRLFGDAIDEHGSGDEHQELGSTISLLNSDVEYAESKIESSGSKVENTGSSLRHTLRSWGSVIAVLVCVGSLLF